MTLIIDGKCSCDEVRYQLVAPPLFVHCCHCTRCQRETGSAFAVNAMIETSNLTVLHGTVELIKTPSLSGNGQHIARCPNCQVALWSHYSGLGDTIAFVRVGTLEQPSLLPPDIHIFTSTKQPWLNLADGVPVVDEYYQRSKYWPTSSLDRLQKLKEELKA